MAAGLAALGHGAVGPPARRWRCRRVSSAAVAARSRGGRAQDRRCGRGSGAAALAEMNTPRLVSKASRSGPPSTPTLLGAGQAEARTHLQRPSICSSRCRRLAAAPSLLVGEPVWRTARDAAEWARVEAIVNIVCASLKGAALCVYRRPAEEGRCGPHRATSTRPANTTVADTSPRSG